MDFLDKILGRKKPPKVEFDEVAIAEKDLDIFAGWGGRLENPDPVINTESGGRGLRLYDEIDRDAHAGSVLQTRYLSITGREWEVLPGDDSAKSKEVADFVWEALKGSNFSQASGELLQGILYGFYVAEVVWTMRDGKTVPAKIYSKHPKRFCFTTDRELRLLTITDQIFGEKVPDRKFIVFSYGSSDNPYGRGLGQKLWWPVWFKKHGIKFWLVFLDKFGQPTPIGKYRTGATPGQKSTLLAAISAIRTETGVTIPDDMAIELLETSRNGQATYETLCEYMDRQISKAVLGQTASTEGTPGKLGNEQGQMDVRQDILQADATVFAEMINETLIKWIVDLNFWGATYPIFSIRTDPPKDLKSLADRDAVLVRDIGLPVSQEYFYDTYNIPEPQEGSTLVKGQASPQVVPGEVEPQFAEKGEFTPGQRALEGLADQAISGVDLSGNEELMVAAVQQAGSHEEAMEAVLGLYSQLDMAGLQEMTARAMLAAEMHGRQTAQENADAA